jgi:hypothetical protein
MTEQNHEQKKSLDAKEIIAILLLPGGLILIYLSFVFFAFNWRVSNEPGFGTAWGLLITAIVLCVTGLVIFIGSHIFLIMRQWKLIFLAWVLCIVVTIGAVSLIPILLLFMV